MLCSKHFNSTGIWSRCLVYVKNYKKISLTYFRSHVNKINMHFRQDCWNCLEVKEEGKVSLWHGDSIIIFILIRLIMRIEIINIYSLLQRIVIYIVSVDCAYALWINYVFVDVFSLFVRHNDLCPLHLRHRL